MRHIMTFFLIVMLVTGVAHAQEITVVTEEFPPFNYTEDGEVKGQSTEIVKAALEKAGIKAEIRIYPWARAYKMAEERKNVLIFSIMKTPARENLFKWIGPVAKAPDAFLYKLTKRTDIQIQSLDDAKPYIIGTVSEWSGHQKLKKSGFEHIEPLANDDANIKKLFAKRVDLIVASDVQIPARVERLGFLLGEIENTGVCLLKGADFYMAFSRQTSDTLVEKVKTAFEQVNSE